MLYEDKPCIDCGSKKEGSYRKGSYCGKCLNERRRVISKQKALEEGRRFKAPPGSGRRKTCSKCGKEKTGAYVSSGYCRECKLESNRQKTLKKRLEAGLQPWGSGLRPLFCYECKKTKEKPNQPYCLACSKEKDKEWRLKTGRTKKAQTGLCPCGAERAKYAKNYCGACAYKIASKSKEQRFKTKVRRFTQSCIKSGFLIPKPCEVCGEAKVDAHHDDYTRPLEVRWLCRNHHVQHHLSEKGAK